MNNLRAAFTLTFNDQLSDKLSGGLKRMTDGVTSLANAAKRLTFGRLVTDASAIDRVTSGIDRMTASTGRAAQGFRAVENAASRAWAKTQQWAQPKVDAVKQWGSKTFGEQSRAGAFAAAAEGLSVAAPIKAYSSLEDEMRRIGIMKGLSGAPLDAEISRLRKFLGEEALATGQTSHIGAETYIDLIKGGVAPQDVEHNLAAHHRAATAFYTDPRDFTKVTSALITQFKVPKEQMDQALSGVGLAANLGMMSVAEFGREFPRIAGLVTSKGMGGREGANKMFAMMQTQMLTSGNAGSAAAEVYDGIAYLYSQSAMNHFAMQGHKKSETHGDLTKLMNQATGGQGFSGINLFRFLRGVSTAGGNPVEAMLDKLQAMKKNLGGDATKMGLLMGGMFGNDQSRNFWQTQLNDREHRQALEAKLNAVDPAAAKQMFDARFAGPEVQLNVMTERLEQLGRRLGQGFLPVMRPVNTSLEYLLHTVEALDDRFPGLIDTVLVVTGGFLAFAAGVAVLGFVWPPLVTGLGLFTGLLKLGVSPLMLFARGAIVAGAALGGVGIAGAAVTGIILAAGVALVASAVYIIRHWERFRDFFVEMWLGIQDVFGGFAEFLLGVFWFDMDRAWRGLQRMWRGVERFFGGVWATVKALFLEFVGWVDEWTKGAATAAIDRIKSAWEGLKTFFVHLWEEIRKPFDQLVDDFRKSPFGKVVSQATQNAGDTQDAEANAMPSWVGPGQGAAKVELFLRADPGTTAEVGHLDSNVTTRGFSLDRGRTLNRP